MKNTVLGVLLSLATLGLPLLHAAPEQTFPPGLIKFERAEIVQVLEIYQELSGRTVLRPADLPWQQKISLRNEVEMTRAQAMRLLEDAFTKAKIKIVPEGEKFVYAVSADRKGNLPKFDAKAMAKKLGQGANPEEVFPSGLVRFLDAQPGQVLPIYASLAGRKAQPAAPNLPQVRFNLRTQTPTTRLEGLFAIEALAALNNLQFSLVGDEEVTLEPLKQNRR